MMPDVSAPLRYLPAIACTLVLLISAAISWTSSIRQSATVDEPLHAVGAYVNTFDRDYRLNPEDPPLWKYWAMLPHRTSDLRIDRNSSEWAQLARDTDAGPRFAIRQL